MPLQEVYLLGNTCELCRMFKQFFRIDSKKVKSGLTGGEQFRASFAEFVMSCGRTKKLMKLLSEQET
jgi:hypothetical protein